MKAYSIIITLLFFGAVAFIVYSQMQKTIETKPIDLTHFNDLVHHSDSAKQAAIYYQQGYDSLKLIISNEKPKNVINVIGVKYISNDSAEKLLSGVYTKADSAIKKYYRISN